MAIDRVLIVLSHVAVLGILSHSSAIAQETDPLSAIEWLSDSVDIPQATPDSGLSDLNASLPPAITVAPLDAPVPDRAGLVSARSLGLDPALWGRSATSEIARAITLLPDARAAPPSLRSFLHDLLIVRLDPPIDATEDDSLYLARLDRLSIEPELVEVDPGAHRFP